MHLKTVLLSALLVTAVAVAFAPAASAGCTVNLGWCDGGNCRVNVGFCGYKGECAVNTATCGYRYSGPADP